MKLGQISDKITMVEGALCSDCLASEEQKMAPPVEEDANEVPEIGDTVRTKKMQMTGKVEKLENHNGYPAVLFRIEDGRLMRAPLDNVVVVEKLADGEMGGINQSAPAQDVSYENVLDEVMGLWNEACRTDELSVDTMQKYRKSATSPAAVQTRPLRKLAKSVVGVKSADAKIAARTGDRTGNRPKQGPISRAHTYEERLAGFLEEECWDGYTQQGMKNKDGKQVPNCVPKTDEAYQGPWQGDPQKYAKAPKTTTNGKGNIRLSDLVQDTINVHGVKHAFEYYVKKHGMPPRHFQIYAGLVADPRKKEAPPAPTPAPAPSAKSTGKESWWKKLRNKLPFEE